MMKSFLLPLIAVLAVCALGIFNIIPAIFCFMIILVVVILKDFIFMFFSRGIPMEIMKARMFGGLLLGIITRAKEMLVGRFQSKAGMIETKEHGLFNVMPSRLYNLGGVALGIAPENVGYNVGIDHAQFIEELKRRGIGDIRELCYLNKFGQVIGFRDDPRIRDILGSIIVHKPKEFLIDVLKQRGIANITDVCDVDTDGKVIGFKDDARVKDLREPDIEGIYIREPVRKEDKQPVLDLTIFAKDKPSDLITFEEFYKFTTEASNPHHQDANVKIGIAQGIKGKDWGVGKWILLGGLAVFFALLGVAVLVMLAGRQTIVIENMAHGAIVA